MMAMQSSRELNVCHVYVQELIALIPILKHSDSCIRPISNHSPDFRSDNIHWSNESITYPTIGKGS